IRNPYPAYRENDLTIFICLLCEMGDRSQKTEDRGQKTAVRPAFSVVRRPFSVLRSSRRAYSAEAAAKAGSAEP
ncbi:MAG: hypothetical protein MUO33_06995, partial [Sedimentisphaerales bacterium]|nr:hypothetical protein [Sedimentisphaerales bacterium]